MLERSNRYRRQAAEALRDMRSVSEPELQQVFFQIANAWLDLAEFEAREEEVRSFSPRGVSGSR
jgi:hypothetical protein